MTSAIKKGRQFFLGLFLIAFLACPSHSQDLKIQKLVNLYQIPGLESINSITGILQDYTGLIWIATQNGLYKFDGYNLLRYAYDPNKPGKIAGSWIESIGEDSTGNIWLGIFGIGLQKLDPITETFTLYKADPSKPTSLPNDKIEEIKWANGKLWLATQGALCTFSPKTGQFKTYIEANVNQFIPGSSQLYIMIGSNLELYDPGTDKLKWIDSLFVHANDIKANFIINNKVYFTVDGSLYTYHLQSKAIERLDPDYPPTISTVYLADSLLFISRNANELSSYNTRSGKFQDYILDSRINKKDFYVQRFFSLSNKDLWLSGKSIYKVILGTNGIELFTMLNNDQPYIPQSPSLYSEWEKGYLCAGKSIFIDFDNRTAKKAREIYPALLPFKTSFMWGNKYLVSYEDENKESWMAEIDRTKWEISLYKFSAADNKLIQLRPPIPAPGTLFGITKIGDNLLIGLWNALFKFNVRSSVLSVIYQGKGPTDLPFDGIRSMYKDRDDGLWLATQGGLCYLKKGTNQFKGWQAQTGDTTGLSYNAVSGITQDSSGLMWISTLGGGVNSFNIHTGKFSWFTMRQGLPDNNVNNIVVDSFQNIWVTTYLGISRINPHNGRIDNFTASDGIHYQFGENNAVRMKDGSLIFAGDGYTRIKPDIIKSDDSYSPIHVIGFKLFNKDVLINAQDSILHRQIDVTHSIQLKYNQNVITFEYAALDMANPEFRNYAYRLVGFDTGWQYVGMKREVTYTNLPAGKYTFRVMSANRSGVWQEMKDPLEIIILPPWWLTWWAYTIYSILFISLVWGFIYYRSRRLKAENFRLEQKVSNRTTELNHSLQELKETQTQLIQREKMASLGELTAGIAHEIQNPLNFVNNFSEVNKELIVEMNEEIDKGNISEVKTIARDIMGNEEKIIHHGKRADAIVKGMLQHSRSTAGLKEATDINTLVDEYLRLSYHGLRAKDKTFNATLNTDFDQTLGKIQIVPQDIGRVLLNLYNNAFYAASQLSEGTGIPPSGGRGAEPTVWVSTKKVGDKVLISVRDNGPGIQKKIIDKIFQPFFTTKPTGQGTGLGLSLSYDIVKAHGGELRVSTIEGEGAEFIVELPIV